MEIQIINLQTKLRIPSRQLTEITRDIFHGLNVRRARLSLVFVTDKMIRKINKQYLRKDRATDVLAFDLRSPAGCLTPGSWQVYAEIIISTETARRNAGIYHVTVDKEIVLYIIHGILHLLGYDDHTSRQRRTMRQAETDLMEQVYSEGRISP